MTCFRSEIGARLAVDTVLELSSDLRIIDLEREEAQVMFRRKLVKEWRERVLAHISANPFSESEFSAYSLPGRSGELRALIVADGTLAYGSTLLFAGTDEEYIIYLQIGDGETFAVEPGGAARTVFPKPAHMLPSETYSLCQSEAWQFTRVALQRRGISGEPILVVVATDGFSNAFPSVDAARDRAVGLRELLTRTDREAQVNIEALVVASSEASLDDATVALLIPPARRVHLSGHTSVPRNDGEASNGV